MFCGELPNVDQLQDAASWTPCLHLHFINQIRTITHWVSTTFMNNNQSGCLCVARGNGWIYFQRTLLCGSPWMTCFFAHPITRLFITIMVVPRIRAQEETLRLWRHHLLLIAHLSQSLLTSRLQSNMSHTVQIKRWGCARCCRAQTVMNGSNGPEKSCSLAEPFPSKGDSRERQFCWIIRVIHPRPFYEGLIYFFFSTCTACLDCISPILEKRTCCLISPRLFVPFLLLL